MAKTIRTTKPKPEPVEAPEAQQVLTANLPPEAEEPRANTWLWDAWGDRPPEAALKDFTRGGGFRGTAIDATYRFQRLTELFGPDGDGWGFTETDRWREDYGGVWVVYVRGFIWYYPPGRDRNSQPPLQTSAQIGGTTVSTYTNAKGNIQTDADEAYKKSTTDAAGKCCQTLGLAAAVYMGLHEGSKYAEEPAGAEPGTGAKGAAPGRRGTPPPQFLADEVVEVHAEQAEAADSLKTLEAIYKTSKAWLDAKQLSAPQWERLKVAITSRKEFLEKQGGNDEVAK